MLLKRPDVSCSRPFYSSHSQCPASILKVNERFNNACFVFLFLQFVQTHRLWKLTNIYACCSQTKMIVHYLLTCLFIKEANVIHTLTDCLVCHSLCTRTCMQAGELFIFKIQKLYFCTRRNVPRTFIHTELTDSKFVLNLLTSMIRVIRIIQSNIVSAYFA